MVEIGPIDHPPPPWLRDEPAAHEGVREDGYDEYGNFDEVEEFYTPRTVGHRVQACGCWDQNTVRLRARIRQVIKTLNVRKHGVPGWTSLPEPRELTGQFVSVSVRWWSGSAAD